MIVDCHTHIWQSPDQLGQMDLGEVRPAQKRPRHPAGSTRTVWRTIPSADPDHHWAQSGAVDKSIVLGFKSRYLRAEIPNRYVADYVSRYPQKLIGFAGIDPTEPGAAEEVRIAKEDLRLRGVTLSPANQDFHPTDSRAMRVYEEAERLAMPILVHPSGQFTEESKLEYGRPYLKGRPESQLMPPGEPWRTGADEATILTTDKALTFGTFKLEPGTYTINTQPGTPWQLMFGKLAKPNQWGIPYQKELEIGRSQMAIG
jgi:hypothetical protein